MTGYISFVDSLQGLAEWAALTLEAELENAANSVSCQRAAWQNFNHGCLLQGLAEWAPTLKAELGPLPTGFFDTPIIVYLLKTRPDYYERCAIGSLERAPSLQ